MCEPSPARLAACSHSFRSRCCSLFSLSFPGSNQAQGQHDVGAEAAAVAAGEGQVVTQTAQPTNHLTHTLTLSRPPVGRNKPNTPPFRSCVVSAALLVGYLSPPHSHCHHSTLVSHDSRRAILPAASSLRRRSGATLCPHSSPRIPRSSWALLTSEANAAAEARGRADECADPDGRSVACALIICLFPSNSSSTFDPIQSNE